LKAIQKDNLMYVSTGEPTYWPSDKRKIPDFLDFGITKGIPAHSVQAVAGFDLSSDHSPVLLTMHTRITHQTRPPTLTSKTTDWVTFQNYINENLTLQVPLKTDRDIEDYVHHLVQYKSYSRLPGSLRQTPLNTQTKTPVHRFSNRKYSTKEGYADDCNTPGPLKIRQT